MKKKTWFFTYLLLAICFISAELLLSANISYGLTSFTFIYTILSAVFFVYMISYLKLKSNHLQNDINELLECNERYRLAFLQHDNLLFEYIIHRDKLFFIDKNTEKKVFVPETINNIPLCLINEPIIDQEFLSTFRIILEHANFYQTSLSQNVCSFQNDGSEIWRKISLKFIFKNDIPYKIIGTVNDITQDIKNIRPEKDGLTSLYSRSAIEDIISSSLSCKKDSRFAFIILDTDNFKNINDEYGHFIGDLVLRNIARVLSFSFKENCTVARMGGDEFCVFMENTTSEETILKKIDNAMEAISQISCGDLKKNTVSLSVGIALFPDHGKTFDELYQNADHALYSAKASGKACTSFFNAA